jgi:hypothetical protein
VIGHEAKARLLFPLARIEKEQFLEVGGPQAAAGGFKQAEKEFLAGVEMHIMGKVLLEASNSRSECGR